MLYFSRWSTIFIVSLCLLGVVFSLPSFLSAPYRAWLPSGLSDSRLSLGLDLQGGSYLLLEAQEDAVIAARLDQLRDDIRTVLRRERIGFGKLTVSRRQVRVSILDEDQVSGAERVLGELMSGGAVSITGLGIPVDQIEMERIGGQELSFSLTEGGVVALMESILASSVEVIRNRIDQLGTISPTIQTQGRDRLMVQVPGLQDPDRLKAILGSTARLTFHLVDSSVSASHALESNTRGDRKLVEDMNDPPRLHVLERQEILTGENVVDAQAAFSPIDGSPLVTFRLDTQGARRFATVTQESVGRLFAIVLDDQVISAPVIREPIIGGSGQITGNFSIEEAHDLAILLRAGALPADLTIIEERVVGAGLGADQIRAGTLAVVIAALAVFLFMFLYYGLLGFFSNVSLIINLAMIVSCLAVLGATLTLPGIAGIVLTVGMAIDSNVLIFERIREERRAGTSVITAVERGFSRTLGAILDANITTLIAAIVLFYLGAGPVRGFAVTLAVGTVTSVFTAFTLTRLLIATWIRWYRPMTLSVC